MEQILNFLPYVGWVLLAITILVFVHEMGHFLAAKLFKMRVDKFSVGFPPKILHKKIGETEYVIGATPLGGYVKIAGMIDESMDTDFVSSEPEPWEFRSKPVWQRIVVITAGVIFNMILAAIILIGLKYTLGEQYIPAEAVQGVYVEEGSIADSMGLRTGDRIVAVGGEELVRYTDFQERILFADPLTVTIERDNQLMTFEGPQDIMTQMGRAGEQGFGTSIYPSVIGSIGSATAAEEAGLQRMDKITAINGEPVEYWLQMTRLIQSTEVRCILVQWERPLSSIDTTQQLGEMVVEVRNTADARVYEGRITPRYDDSREAYMLGVGQIGGSELGAIIGFKEVPLAFSEAVGLGLQETWSSSVAIVTSLKRIFTGRENLRDNLGGPVAVAKVTKEAADAGPSFFWRIVAMLSITLAIMNILPIPALDGGHLVFLIYEGITRREPSLKVRMWLQQIGMVLLLVFMTFLVFNDILRL